MFARRSTSFAVAFSAAALFTLSAVTFGQGADKKKGPPQKPAYGNFWLETKIGSFRMMEFNDDSMPEGHFEMSFTGTVLVDTSEAVKHPRGLQTTIHTEGSVKEELNYHGRRLFHGTGKIVVDGGWHALQWFGRDMSGKFSGSGVFRLSGEFDKSLNTGQYWYEDGKKFDWGTSGQQPTVPLANMMSSIKPTIKINGKG
jgi:hypothetical protein